MTKTLEISAEIKNLQKVLEFTERMLDGVAFSGEDKKLLLVAVEEIFVNIVNYAYEPDKGNAVISISAEDGIIIEIQDSGKPYNPLEKPDPDLIIPVEKREVGGLGIYMVKIIADKVEYKHENGRNVLTLIKNIL